ncbi:TPA: hypothetical protein SB504_001896, partial [Campylobacter jejuni]|nr:hypothetical protein [Campylobacter jejuni]
MLIFLCYLKQNFLKFLSKSTSTHAFLGLTKDKSPDELDKADETLRQEYLKNKEFK